MIRIDLGKDELQNSPKKAKAINLSSLKLGKINFDRILRFRGLSRFSANVSGILLVGGALVIGIFPHLFFSQYRSFIIKQHEGRISGVRERIDAINREVAKFQPFQKELESYEMQKKMVRDRLEIVRTLLEARGTPVNILDALGQSLPLRVWITKVSLSLLATKTALSVTGNSYTNEDISDFVDKLSESVYFSDVTLEKVDGSRGDAHGADFRTFSLNAKPKAKFSFFASAAEKTPAGASAATARPAGIPAGVPPANAPGAPPSVPSTATPNRGLTGGGE